MFGETEFKVKYGNGYNYIDVDSDREGHTLVFLHGMFGGLSNFDPLLKQLQGYSIFVPKIPVYELEQQLSIPRLSEWLHSVLKERGIQEVILLGNSMGGHIALEYILRHSEMVDSLILTGSSGLFENDLGSTKPKRYDRDYIKERAAMTFYDDLVNDTIIDEILDVLQSPDKLGRLLKIARSTHEYNMEDKLHRIDQPVLLIWGRDDIITPQEVAETFLAKLPNATLKWIDRCGHAPMMERPKEFAVYLTDFLRKQKVKAQKKDKDKHEEDYSHF